MPGIARSDFLRIVLPGAVAVGLIDFALRLISATPQPQVSVTTIDFIHAGTRLIEDPFRGTAVAAFFGLMAYYADPGYASPSYSKDLPSDHLKRCLDEWGIQSKNPTGLYFLLFDEYMSPVLRERALLYGEFFRVAVHVIVGSMFAAVSLPIALMLVTTASVDRAPLGSELSMTGAAMRITAIALFLMAGMLARRRSNDRRRGDNSTYATPWVTTAVITGLGVGGWIFSVEAHVPAFIARCIIICSVTLAYVSWLVARQQGHLAGVFVNLWRGRTLRSKPFDDTGVFAIDCAIGLVSLIGVVEISSALRLLQIAGVVAVLAASLTVAYLRKHERQLSGVKSNQREWLDRNEAIIRAVALGDGHKLR